MSPKRTLRLALRGEAHDETLEQPGPGRSRSARRVERGRGQTCRLRKEWPRLVPGVSQRPDGAWRTRSRRPVTGPKPRQNLTRVRRPRLSDCVGLRRPGMVPIRAEGRKQAPTRDDLELSRQDRAGTSLDRLACGKTADRTVGSPEDPHRPMSDSSLAPPHLRTVARAQPAQALGSARKAS